MSQESRQPAPLFTQVDIGAAPPTSLPGLNSPDEQTRLLRDLLAAQDRQTNCSRNWSHSSARRSGSGSRNWRSGSKRTLDWPRVAGSRPRALSKVQSEFLQALTDEVAANAEDLAEGDFVFNEFIDRFGPRLAHLNGVIQVLAQLSSAPNPTNNS